MKIRTAHPLVLGAISIISLTIGCASAAEPEGSSADALSSGETSGQNAPAYPRLMREILEASAEDMVALGMSDDSEGDVAPAAYAIRPTTVTTSVRPLGLIDLTRMTIAGHDACAVLRPLKPLEHGFFFGGMVVTGGAGVQVNKGTEGAVDIYNQQAAVFNFEGGGLSPQVGFSAGAYTGIGADLQARTRTNLKDLWGGVFYSVSGSFGLAKFVSVNASGFVSADGTIAGASVGAAGGWGAPLAVFSNVSVQGSNYVFNREATRSFFGGAGDGSAYFSTARDVTRAVLKVSPGISYNGIGRRTLTNFLIEAILKAKYANRSLSALCPG